MKRTAIISTKPRRLRDHAVRMLLLGVTVMAVAGAFASAARATEYNTSDIGRGSCRLRDPGAFGTGGPSTITAPDTTWTNFAFPGHSWVTVKAWTIVIDADTGARKNTNYDGPVTVSATATQQVNVPSVTLDIQRSVSDYFNAKIEVVLATYDYYSGALLEVDTGIASSYWLYHNGGYFHDNVGVLSC
jgi:hypothetical protein